MKTLSHMGRTITKFPMPVMVRIRCLSGPGERILDMIYKAFRKRKRIEYFKAQQRRKKRASGEKGIQSNPQ